MDAGAAMREPLPYMGTREGGVVWYVCGRVPECHDVGLHVNKSKGMGPVVLLFAFPWDKCFSGG